MLILFHHNNLNSKFKTNLRINQIIFWKKKQINFKFQLNQIQSHYLILNKKIKIKREAKLYISGMKLLSSIHLKIH